MVETYECRCGELTGTVTADGPGRAAIAFGEEMGWHQDMTPLVTHDSVEVRSVESGQRYRFFVECEIQHKWFVRYEMPAEQEPTQ